MKLQVLLLAAAQALFQTASVLVMTVASLCSLAAAALLRGLGWQMLNLALLPWLAAAFLAVLGLASAIRASARIKA